jgi:hypothetical protein
MLEGELMQSQSRLSRYHQNWTKLWFGKHRGKTLPQVMFADPQWFWWVYDREVFQNKGALAGEAQEVYGKARRIRIPQRPGERRVAEYVFHPRTGEFAGINFVPPDAPSHEGSSPAFKLGVIDLAVPSRAGSRWDRAGDWLLLRTLKYLVFGSKQARATSRRCEEFFADDRNFDFGNDRGAR